MLPLALLSKNLSTLSGSGLLLHARAPGQIDVLRVPEEQEADNDRHQCDADRIVKARIDVARPGHDGSGQQRQHSAEPAIADVIRQRHRRIADLGREQLDEERGDGAIDHRYVDQEEEQDHHRGEPIDLRRIGLGRELQLRERGGPCLRVEA